MAFGEQEVLGAQLLHNENSQFHITEIVESSVRHAQRLGEETSQKPVHKIAVFLGRLSNLSEEVQGRLLEQYANQTIISKSDVPGAPTSRHAAKQAYEAYENKARQIRSDQKDSLSLWTEYLKEADHYPAWFCYYALAGVARMGQYNAENKSFVKRSKTATALFPVFNAEALSMVYEQTAPMATGKVALRGFSKSYAHALEELADQSIELTETIEGSWRTFKKGDDQSGTELARSLQGYNTNWCVRGESTAQSYLKNGNFYVYYLRNEAGDDIIPRIAISTTEHRIGEIRGVLPHQKLEPELRPIAREKALSLPEGESLKAHFEAYDQFIASAEDVLKNGKTDDKTIHKLMQIIKDSQEYQASQHIAEFDIGESMIEFLNDVPEDIIGKIIATKVTIGTSWRYNRIEKLLWSRLSHEDWAEALTQQTERAIHWRKYLYDTNVMSVPSFDNDIAEKLLKTDDPDLFFKHLEWFKMTAEILPQIKRSVKMTRNMRKHLLNNARRFGMRRSEMYSLI